MAAPPCKPSHPFFLPPATPHPHSPRLLHGPTCSPTPPTPPFSSDSGTRAVLAILCQRGLLQTDPYTSTYRLHPTVARFVLTITTPLESSVLASQQQLALEALSTALALHQQSHTPLALQLLNAHRGVLHLALHRFCTEPTPLATRDNPTHLALLEVLGEGRPLLATLLMWRPQAMERGWHMVLNRGGELGWLGSLAKMYRGQAMAEAKEKWVKEGRELVERALEELAQERGQELRYARGLEMRAELEVGGGGRREGGAEGGRRKGV